MKSKLILNAICLVVLVCAVFVSMKNEDFKINAIDKDKLFNGNSISITPGMKNDEEMKAVWVSFLTLNMKDTDYSEQAFRSKFDNIIKVAKEHHLNTLIVHVRPFGDALYDSKIFPWSHIVSKKQGENPGYDPLKYMVEASHRAGLKIHAWVNPLRVQKNNSPNSLSSDNPFVKWENAGEEKFLLKVGEAKYYNPACDEVREMIINGAAEIVENYDVDGIQFDDYFYPNVANERVFCAADENKNDLGLYDKTTYDEYCACASNAGTPLSLLQWRTCNINNLIAGCYSKIKSINPNVIFGISPQCNVKNDEMMGADVYKWGAVAGYVDYLCPQVYVNFEHPILPFKTAVDNWKKIVKDKNVKLYFGLAAYKAGSDLDGGTWLKSNDILKNEVEYCRNSGCDGFMIFDINNLSDAKTKEEIKNMMSVLN